MSEKHTRSEIVANRTKWAEFLMKPDRRKGRGWLDIGKGERDVFGHGAFVLGVKRQRCFDPEKQCFSFAYGEDLHRFEAPLELVQMVGLYDDLGKSRSGAPIEIAGCIETSLASANDFTGATPRLIGNYLMACLEGGEDTPFRPLGEYPE